MYTVVVNGVLYTDKRKKYTCAYCNTVYEQGGHKVIGGKYPF